MAGEYTKKGVGSEDFASKLIVKHKNLACAENNSKLSTSAVVNFILG
jgi:hypothetical protein